MNNALYIETLVRRIHELERQNANLRAHNVKLTEARDKWRLRVTERRTTIERLRSAVYALKQSRDMWRHRATTR